MQAHVNEVIYRLTIIRAVSVLEDVLVAQMDSVAQHICPHNKGHLLVTS